MRLPALHRILIDGARRQEQAQGGPRTLPMDGRRAFIALLAVLLLAGTAVGAVITLTRSRPLSGTLPQGPSTHGLSHYRINVFPYMAVGWSGWCSSVLFNAAHTKSASIYGCEAVESNGPFIAGGEFADATGSYSYGIVADTVTAVHFSDGKAVQPIANPRLPPGTRAYFTVSAKPTHAGQRSEMPLGRTLLDSGGHEIPEPRISRENAVERLPQVTANPRHAGTAPCAVRAPKISRLVPLSEAVATPVRWPRHQFGAFLACANAMFRLDGSTLAAAVLVDASNAWRPAPPLPELQPDLAHPGLLTGRELGNIGLPQGSFVASFAGGRAFTTPSPGFADHDVSARRAGGAWLIAEGGTSAQRAALLALITTDA